MTHNFRRTFQQTLLLLLFLAMISLVVLALLSRTPSVVNASPTPVATAVQTQPRISVDGFYGATKAQRGRTVQAAIVMDIPRGYHVNANKPLGKYAVPTTVKVNAPEGVDVGAVSYPRGAARSFQFAPQEKLAVYEGRVVMPFTVNVPANFNGGSLPLRATIKFQSCNDEVCFPPISREVSMPIAVVDANAQVERINGNLFTGRRGK